MDDAYQADKNEVREVHYAGKDALIAEIEKRVDLPPGAAVVYLYLYQRCVCPIIRRQTNRHIDKKYRIYDIEL